MKLYNERINLSSYQEYKIFVKNILQGKLRKKGKRKWLKNHLNQLLSVYLLNFDPIQEKLAGLYSSKKVGKPPYDPQVLLRSLFLMAEMQETSITKWANNLEYNEILMIFCGLSGKKAPSVGAYYDFLKRLENGCYQAKCPHCVRASDVRKAQRTHTDYKEKPNDLDEVQGKEKRIMDEFVERLKRNEQEPVQYDLERLLNEILREIGIKPSIKKGFIQDLENWTLVGDGSVISADVNSYGRATCDCRKKGIYNCKHERIYSDPQANWGWDNRDKCLKFGYHYFQWVDSNHQHDLPIYLQIGPGNLYEPKMALDSIDRITKDIKSYGTGARVKEIALDAMHDLYATYRYLRYKNIDYAIPLRKEPANCIELGNSSILCNKNGCPLCPGHACMVRAGMDKAGRHIYQCPAKRGTHENGKMVRKFRAAWCPRGIDCMPESKIGPLVHVSCDIDPRIHPNIPRDSKQYRDLYNKRTGCERSNATKKCTYRMGITRVRVMCYAYIRMALISILEHSRVWTAEHLKHVDLNNVSLMSLFA